MHTIEPFFGWRGKYIASNDNESPFYGVVHSEFHYSNTIYNHYIHPQWDFFGSSTLYCKVLFADYEEHVAIIELMGEWNDAVHNDVMELKRFLIDPMIDSGISRFVLIGENVLNFHASDALYYEEWEEAAREEDGWIIAINLREHIISEMRQYGIHHSIFIGGNYNHVNWRKLQPEHLVELLDKMLVRSIGE